MDSATLATWEQNYVSFSPNNLYFSRGSSLLFQLIDRGNNTIALEDCEGTPMYTMRRVDGGYDITDAEQALVARGRAGASDHFPNQMLFTDAHGEPIAVADTPTKPLSDDRSQGEAQVVCQVRFYGSSSTNSSLIHAQRRWVVAAAVQEFGIEEQLLRRSSFLLPWLIGAWLLATILVLFALYGIVTRGLLPSRGESMDERYPVTKEHVARDYGGLMGRLPGQHAAA